MPVRFALPDARQRAPLWLHYELAEWVPLWLGLLLFFLLQALVIFIVPNGRDFQDERPWRHG